MAAELKAKVSLNTTSFDRGLRRLRRTARNFGRSFGRPMSDAAGRMARFGVMATAVAAGGFAVLIKKTAEFGDMLDKMSKRTGISTRTLAALGHSAELAGGSITGMEKGIKTMTMAIDQARLGMKSYNDAFAEIGLTSKDFDNLSTDQAFLKILKALGKTKDKITQSAVASRIFGRAGRQLIPMIKDLDATMARAKALGIMIPPEQAAAAAAFDDSLTNLKGALRGLALSGINFKPFTDGINVATAAVIKFRKSGKFRELQKRFTSSVSHIVRNALRMKNVWGNLQDSTRTMVKNMTTTLGVLAIAWKIGFVQPILALTTTFAVGIARKLVFILTDFRGFVAGLAATGKAVAIGMARIGFALTGGLAAIMVAIAGFSLGEALQKRFNLKKFFTEASRQLAVGMATFVKFVESLKNMKWSLNPKIDIKNAINNLGKIRNELDRKSKKILHNMLGVDYAPRKNKNTFIEDYSSALQKNMDKIVSETDKASKAIGENWKKISDPIKKGIADIKTTLKKTKLPKLPDMPKLPDLPKPKDADGIKQVADGMNQLKKAMSGVPSRGMVVAIRQAVDEAKKMAGVPDVVKRIKARLAAQEQARKNRRNTTPAAKPTAKVRPAVTQPRLTEKNVGGATQSLAGAIGQLVKLAKTRNATLTTIAAKNPPITNWV